MEENQLHLGLETQSDALNPSFDKTDNLSDAVDKQDNLLDTNEPLTYLQKEPEYYYCNKLAAMTNGETEVRTLAGRIDVLTPYEVIEVKHCKLWKNAVGQVTVYSTFYPQLGKRIHLLGRPKLLLKDLIDITCVKLGIRVTWEFELDPKHGEETDDFFANNEDIMLNDDEPDLIEKRDIHLIAFGEDIGITQGGEKDVIHIKELWELLRDWYQYNPVEKRFKVSSVSGVANRILNVFPFVKRHNRDSQGCRLKNIIVAKLSKDDGSFE